MSRQRSTAADQLSRSVSGGALAIWGLLALAWGLLAGLALAEALPSTRPDRVVTLAALAAFPTPLWLLGLLSTPPHAACRRTLGQEAVAVLHASVRAALWVIALSVAAPLALAASAVLHPEAAHDLLRGAALVACAATVPDEAGNTECVVLVTETTPQVRLEVTDSEEAVGFHDITLVVLDVGVNNP